MQFFSSCEMILEEVMESPPKSVNVANKGDHMIIFTLSKQIFNLNENNNNNIKKLSALIFFSFFDIFFEMEIFIESDDPFAHIPYFPVEDTNDNEIIKMVSTFN